MKIASIRNQKRLNEEFNKALKDLQEWALTTPKNNIIPINKTYKQQFSEDLVKHCIQIQHNYNRWLEKKPPEDLSKEYLEKEYNNMTAIERDEIVWCTY